MADMHQVARQWLETDAAFGVTEVPVPSPGARPSKPVDVTHVAQAVPAPMQMAVRRAVPPEAAGVMPPVGAASHAALLADMGPSSPRKAAAARTPALPPTPAGNIHDLTALTRKQKEASLQELLQDVQRASAECLNDISTRVVFGEGDPDTPLMFVGEGPGAEEDKTGRPFVGRSGQLLDKMISAIGFRREQVYIANVVKLRCADWADGAYGRRLQDRPPTPEEVARGLPFLHRQIEIIRPKVIVTLGAPAVKWLTGTTEGVMKIRGTWLSYRGVPVMPTYHPSFVLRAYTEENRRKVWSDLKEAVKRIKGE